MDSSSSARRLLEVKGSCDPWRNAPHKTLGRFASVATDGCSAGTRSLSCPRRWLCCPNAGINMNEPLEQWSAACPFGSFAAATARACASTLAPGLQSAMNIATACNPSQKKKKKRTLGWNQFINYYWLNTIQPLLKTVRFSFDWQVFINVYK